MCWECGELVGLLPSEGLVEGCGGGAEIVLREEVVGEVVLLRGLDGWVPRAGEGGRTWYCSLLKKTWFFSWFFLSASLTTDLDSAVARGRLNVPAPAAGTYSASGCVVAEALDAIGCVTSVRLICRFRLLDGGRGRGSKNDLVIGACTAQYICRSGIPISMGNRMVISGGLYRLRSYAV